MYNWSLLGDKWGLLVYISENQCISSKLIFLQSDTGIYFWKPIYYFKIGIFYQNAFRQATTITFCLSKTTSFKIIIYNNQCCFYHQKQSFQFNKIN